MKQITVTKCNNCPFCVIDKDGPTGIFLISCQLIEFQKSSLWDLMNDNETLFEGTEIEEFEQMDSPDRCPLRQEEININLKE